MPKTKVEVYDKDQLIYPFIESDHVTFSNGMKVSEMLDQSISMPTVTHEDLSFKVGVGDQDVSSAIVDSSVSEMTIKGKTYQNILPEPSTHVLTNNKEMFKVNEGLDPNVEIVDGVSKSAILSGQTLVNVLAYIKVGGNVPLVKNSNVIEVESTTENTWRSVDIDFTYLKPNTKYIVTWDSITFSNTNFVPTSSLISVRLKTDNTQIAGWDSSRNYIIATVPSNTSDVKLRVHASQGTAMINKTTVKGLKVVEYVDGMENWDIPYFEGMQSVKMPGLTTTGKNLLPPVKNTWYPCRFKQGTTFKLSTKDSVPSNGGNVVFKDINGTSVWFGIDSGNTTSTKVLPCDVYYISNSLATDVEHQLEIGKQVTSYESYKTNILSCQLAPLNQSMFEQGTFAESTPPNTKTYQQIKLDSNNLYTTRIRTKGTYKVVKGATYEAQLNDGYGIFVCFCKNGLYSATINRWLDGTSTFTVPNDCDEMFFAIKKTDNTTITPSDYSRIGLKIHQEVVLRSLPNGVRDTLNLNTGEYVQRIGEVVLNGSEAWGNAPSYTNGNPRFCYDCSDLKIRNNVGNQLVLTNSDTIISVPSDVPKSATKGVFHHNTAAQIHIFIPSSEIGGTTPSNFKTYLQQNPVTVQYELATPIIKTVDLSTSGNWEKVVLDGKSSEDWKQNSHSGNFVQFEGYSNFCLYSMNLPVSNRGLLCDKLSYYGYDSKFRHTKIEGISDGGGYRLIFVRVKTEKLPTNDVAGFKQWLSQNPIEVSYMLSSNKDSTQVKQPIFFKDGHIIQSSGADNSLIPTLDYQAKTSNSYVMDLMKANTRYTMKAKSANGTFTIDGTSYGAGTNGTFTTPSSMTNKFLVMSNKTNTEVMILEGDLTSKTVPYFKGIKSAFEDESKIEVLSQGKNLFDVNEVQTDDRTRGAWETRIEGNKIYSMRVTSQVSGGEFGAFIQIPVKPSVEYVYKFDFTSTDPNLGDPQVYIYNNSSIWGEVLSSNNGKTTKFTTKANTQFITIGLNYRSGVQKGTEFCTYNAILIETTQTRDYEPYKSNSTKIPLLSPLRSLPNGVCDEIILDRENNKAKIIQRVGEITYDGADVWGTYTVHQNNVRIQTTLPNCVRRDTADFIYAICDKLPSVIWNYSWLQNYNLVTVNHTNIHLQLSDTTMTKQQMLSWLTQNPITVYYELETPVITEIDLEGFPYIYKDGHIFLNSEIVPTTEIVYSVNQCQQISASNEDIIRHEKELTYLQKLIAQYVQVDYESALLSLKV